MKKSPFVWFVRTVVIAVLVLMVVNCIFSAFVLSIASVIDCTRGNGITGVGAQALVSIGVLLFFIGLAVRVARGVSGFWVGTKVGFHGSRGSEKRRHRGAEHLPEALSVREPNDDDPPLHLSGRSR